MRELVLIPPRSGEVVGDAPDRRVEILSDDETLNATWSRFGPGREGADLHIHRHHTDFFYVLEGELTVALGSEGNAVAVRAGTLARVPRLVRRQRGLSSIKCLPAPIHDDLASAYGLPDISGSPVAADRHR